MGLVLISLNLLLEILLFKFIRKYKKLGAFGDNGCLGFLLTEYDEEVDKTSLNPKKQM